MYVLSNLSQKCQKSYGHLSEVLVFLPEVLTNMVTPGVNFENLKLSAHLALNFRKSH